MLFWNKLIEYKEIPEKIPEFPEIWHKSPEIPELSKWLGIAISMQDSARPCEAVDFPPVFLGGGEGLADARPWQLLASLPVFRADGLQAGKTTQWACMSRLIHEYVTAIAFKLK